MLALATDGMTMMCVTHEAGFAKKSGRRVIRETLSRCMLA
jgi:ABC-type polar amino acid transport system ATPase subunit